MRARIKGDEIIIISEKSKTDYELIMLGRLSGCLRSTHIVAISDGNGGYTGDYELTVNLAELLEFAAES